MPSKKPVAETKPIPPEKPTNPDRIDDQWRPPVSVSEPGQSPEIYLTGKKLGKGGFAVCFEGRVKATAEVFALKVVKAQIEQKKMLEKFRTELQIHAKMRHPNIVEFLKAFTVEDHTYVVLELCHNGNLTDMVKARRCLSLPEVRRFMIQICGGVKYMHKRNVIHRDLKMGNVFLDSRMNIKIGDFGLAAVVADEQDRRTTLCGTPNYIAPEILSKSSSRGHDNKVDTWAIGVICYAMLMGTPPFQSKTQQEIYTKLRGLEYEWKIDSKNYITPYTKNFVASCLTLSSADRPEMDDLVEDDFFKYGGPIAEPLESSCLKTSPAWLLQADPRGDKTIIGYGVSHEQMCMECGVGRLANGRPRPAVGQKATTSALFEIEAENRQGCAPTTPLPEGILYQPMASTSADIVGLAKSIPSLPRSRKLPGEVVNGVAALEENMDIESRLPASVSTLPTRVLPSSRLAQSFAAQQRQQAIPSRNVPRGIAAPHLPVQTIDLTEDEPPIAQNRGYLRERPVRSASIRATRSAASKAAPETEKPLKKSLTLPGKLKEMADDSPQDQAAEVVMPTRSRSKTRSVSQNSPPRRYASRELRSTEIPLRQRASSSSLSSTVLHHRALQPTSGNDRQAVPNQQPKATPLEEKISSDSAPVPSTMSPTRPKCRTISNSDGFTYLPHSSSQDILESLRSLHIALSPSASKQNRPRSRSLSRRASRPRVDKWVDYSTRHGIAYILADDTVGLILKSNQDNSRPSASVVMRNAKAHEIRRVKGTEGQVVPQGDRKYVVEFFEREVLPADDDKETSSGSVRSVKIPANAFQLDLAKYKNDTAAAMVGLVEDLRGPEAERLKAIGLLDKFGKYMSKVGDSGSDEEDSVDGRKSRKAADAGLYVDFYQRLGNVGIWGFRDQAGDAGLQVNFPDHTKLVVYRDNRASDDWIADVVHLAAHDARELTKPGVNGLTTDAFERRSVMTRYLSDFVAPSEAGTFGKADEETVRANELREKMAWIRGVVGCWVKNGEMGNMGREEGRVGWSGLQERRAGARVKLTWGTVGRVGGDAFNAPAVSGG